MIRITVRASLALGVLLAAGAAGCGEDPTGGQTPIPGEMIATLASPVGAEGSAVLEVSSGTVTGVTSDDPDLLVYLVATHPVRIVAVRGIPGAVVFQVGTDDVTRPPELRVADVGGPDDALRVSLGGYSVTLVEAGGS
jgi:hypothetical protein